MLYCSLRFCLSKFLNCTNAMPNMGASSALLIVVICTAAVSCEGIRIERSSSLSTDASSSDDELKARFESFMASHGRRYSPAEQEERFSIWLDNLDVVELLNDRSLGATFSADGPFGDMTPQEFSRRVLMAPQAAPTHPAERYMQASQARDDLSVPEEKDWRLDGAVTPVKDQGDLGSCWAFSTIENLEGQLFLSHGDLTPLSVEQLVECDNSTDHKHDKGDCGEFGGWPYLAYEYLIGAGGIHSDETFPYCSGIPYGDEGNCMPCMAPGYDKQECGDHSDFYCNASTTKGQVPGGLCEDMSDAVAQVADWKAVGPDEGDIKEQLAAVGPLSTAINAALLQFYWYGIYDPYDYLCDPEALDHAVLLVGYGAEDGKDFWTVKNSWGASWGEDGYFRIVRGTGKCGINTAVTTGLLEVPAAHKAGGRNKSPSTPSFTTL